MQQPQDNQPESGGELLCDRCDGTMERGFTIDRSHNGAHQHMWCPGVATRSFWSGGVKSHHLTTGINITTYRCTRCGRLESFALPPEHRNDHTA